MSDLVTARWPLAPSSAIAWLLELTGDEGITGFMPPPMPDAAWVINAMYEHEQGPADVSYDEYQRAGVADGSIEPQILAGIDFSGVGTATGGDLGRAARGSSARTTTCGPPRLRVPHRSSRPPERHRDRGRTPALGPVSSTPARRLTV